MKLLSLWIFIYISMVLSKPTEDVETMVDSSSTTDPLTQQKETMVDEESGDGDEMKEDNIADLMDFELSLFSASSVFGYSFFQKLQESLRVLRDQLNSMWNMNMNMLDMPNDYKNSTSHSKIINGSLVTVNETISKVIDANGIQSFHHTKVILISPHNDTDHSAQEEQMSQQKMISSETDSELIKRKNADSDNTGTNPADTESN